MRRASSQAGSHRAMEWFGLEGSFLVPTLCYRQGHLPLDQVAPSSLALSFTHLLSPAQGMTQGQGYLDPATNSWRNP